MEFCPHCMQPAEGEKCASCGKQMQHTAEQDQLALGTILRGAYQVGAAVAVTETTITYAAMDLKNGRRVQIREYYPAKIANRIESQWVMPVGGKQDRFDQGLGNFWDEANNLTGKGITVYELFDSQGTGYAVTEFVDGSRKKSKPVLKTKPKKKKKKLKIFLIILIVLLVLGAAAAAVWHFWFRAPDVTKDGFVYETKDGVVTITGYEGFGGEVTIPETIGEAQVKYIADAAFDAQDDVTSLVVGGAVEPSDDAFSDCEQLQIVRLQGETVSQSWRGALWGCDALSCVMLSSQEAYDHAAQTGAFAGFKAHISYVGQPVIDGTVNDVLVHNGVIYGLTDDDAQVLRVPAGQGVITIEQSVENKLVTWICDGALEGVDPATKINLPKETFFDYDLFDAAHWLFLDDKGKFTAAQCWYYTCKYVKESNLLRPQDVPPLVADAGIVRAAMVLAEEQNEDINRPDGRAWTTALDDAGVQYEHGFIKQNHFLEEEVEARTQCFSDIVATYAAPIAEGELAGMYYTRVGLAQFFVVRDKEVSQEETAQAEGEETTQEKEKDEIYYICAIGVVDNAGTQDDAMIEKDAEVSAQ